MNILQKIGLFFLVILYASCTEETPPAISFYYWRTTHQLSFSEKNTIKDNNVSKLYIRYFDIDLNSKNEPVPRSAIQFYETPSVEEIIPVVYIKNHVFFDATMDVSELAIKVNKYIAEISASIGVGYKEVQIDCDWSLKSKNKYLEFIESFKKVSKKRISATIRLHQVKYFDKTSIPNVDSGVLMYYNMGVVSTDSLNSIYDKAIASQYIKSLKKYPLSLNFALPIFSWGIHIRNDKVMGLRSKINAFEIKSDTNFIALEDSFYKIKHPFFRKGIFYKKNDLLKIEAIEKRDLLEMVNDLKRNTSEWPKEIIFYDLDSLNLRNYERKIFKEVIANF